MTINWYPGHMVTAKREIEENIKLVDIVAILLDARAPFSCRNADLERLAGRKKVVFILNKKDLADNSATKAYSKRLRQEGKLVAAMDSISGRGGKDVLQTMKTAYKEQEEILIKKGRRVRAARVMIVGVPNIGKSTFLNSLVGKKMAKTGAKPGVTRGKQWIRVLDNIELMDTPGLMWPKVADEEQGLKLALLDIVGENAYNDYDVALYLLKVLKEKAPQILRDVLKVENTDEKEFLILEHISTKRGHLVKGGVADVEKTARVLLQEFRKGKLGCISLD